MACSDFLVDRALLIAVICGRALLIVFVVGVILAFFPIDLGSAEWGVRLSGIIAENASLALVGIALLGVVAFSRPVPCDPETSCPVPVLIGRQRIFVLRLLRFGSLGLLLLILWQPILLQQQAGVINRRDLGRSSGLLLALQSTEKTIQNASDAELNGLWQVFADSQPAGSTQVPVTLEGKRRALLAAVNLEINQSKSAIEAQRRRSLLVAALGLLRRISLYCVYGASLYALHRFLRRA